MNKQIEEMVETICDIDCKGMKCNTCDRYCCEYRTLAEAIYNAGYRRQEWISVDERLPEKDGIYLVWDCGMHRGVSVAEVRITHFKHGDRYHDYMWRNHYSHWMPLPEPPMMKGGEADA